VCSLSVLYTGSPRVGRIVATAAAKHLTPVSLELGGKNPVFVDSTADLALAARRILWGRCANAGQICLSPDYVLVQRDVQDSLVEEFVKSYKTFYPEGARKSDSLARLVSSTAWKRVKNILDRTKGTVVVGGGSDEGDLFIEPTVLKDVALDDITMDDEIFGPILSLIAVDSVEEALLIVNSR
jgi:acyl-CoA reductase-like NAD-dependent aldehyde dehydrogenase